MELALLKIELLELGLVEIELLKVELSELGLLKVELLEIELLEVELLEALGLLKVELLEIELCWMEKLSFSGGCSAVVDAASVIARGGRATKSTAPKFKTVDGTSNFCGPFEDSVLLKTNLPEDSDSLKRLSPVVSDETARCGTPSKLKKTMSVTLCVGKVWSNLN